jgi:hypothetical protein
MDTYQVKSVDIKLFELTQGAVEKGRLEYDSWFSFKAEIMLADQTQYAVQPKGLWGTTIEIKAQEQVLLDFKMNWKGQILIRTLFDGNEVFYIFRQQGLLKSTFVFLDNEEQELLNIEPNFKWSRLNFDYQIVAADAFGQLAHQYLLLLTAVHCANYYITMMTSVAVM